MGKLFREKHIVVYLFTVALVFFFFAQRSTVKLQEQILNGDAVVIKTHQVPKSAQFSQRLDTLVSAKSE